MSFRILFLTCLWISLLPGLGLGRETPPMNIILILVDDWGYADAAVQGSDLYETPNIDRLAATGARFTQAYAACTVCSPTRAAMMTGKYPARLRVTDWIAGHTLRFKNRPMNQPDWTQYLDHEEETVAELLKAQGYRTASVGKWHLTPKLSVVENREWWPEHHGFDINIGANQWGQPGSFFAPFQWGRRVHWNMPPSVEGDYLTDRLTDEVIEIMQVWKDKGAPFFIYLPYYTVHTPIQAKKETIAYYEGKVKAGMLHTNPTYAAMVDHLDENIGRILDALEDLGIADSTAIFLTGDNGGLDPHDEGSITNNHPLRHGKGGVYEGGVRVPGFARVPGITQPGIVLDTPIITMDFFSTAVSLGNGVEPADTDGLNLTGLLSKGDGALPARDLFWHYPHYHTQGARPYSAIRSGDWRLIEYHLDGAVELYNLAEDIGETQNLAATRPDMVALLVEKLHAWREEVDAQMAIPNPDFDPSKPIDWPDYAKKSATDGPPKRK